MHRNNFNLDPHIFLSIWSVHTQHYALTHTKCAVHTLNITDPHKVWWSYTQYYAPKQNLMFIHSTLSTHTNYVHTLSITHPHKIWCSYNQHHAPTQNLVFIRSKLRTQIKIGDLTLNTKHPHKIWCSYAQHYAHKQNSWQYFLFI